MRLMIAIISYLSGQLLSIVCAILSHGLVRVLFKTDVAPRGLSDESARLRRKSKRLSYNIEYSSGQSQLQGILTK